MNKDKRLLGAHLSTAGGLMKTLERARALGADSVQIFANNPRGWKGTAISSQAAEEFKQSKKDYGVEVLVIHAIYLVNLASPKKDIRDKSYTVLKRDLISAGRLAVKHIVLHPGSDLGEAGGVERLIVGLEKIRPFIPAGCKVLLEGMAGTKNSLGDLPTLKHVLSAVGKKQFGVCLDTAHLFASGYDLRKKKNISQLLQDIKQTVGIKSVECIHLNDSKKACGSKRDHHENLGEGYIGKTGLINMLSISEFQHCPVIIETPGFGDLGPDLENMRRMKKYCRIAQAG